jgi:hypothetical protein
MARVKQTARKSTGGKAQDFVLSPASGGVKKIVQNAPMCRPPPRRKTTDELEAGALYTRPLFGST